jgi:DNA invertase Pin-like site-specific DNA recombinase
MTPANLTAPMRGYGRVSRGEGRSTVDVQRTRIRQWATLQDATVADPILVEEAVSGGLAAHERGLGDLIEAVERGEASGVVVLFLDRMGRNLIELLKNVERIKDAGGRFVAIHEGIDTASDPGQIQLALFGMLAQIQRDRYAENWSNAVADAVADGVWPSSNVPLGYVKTPIVRNDAGKRTSGGQLEVDPNTAPHVQWAFEARAARRSWGAITAELRRRGVRISKTGVTSMLASRVYRGEIVNGNHVNPSAHPALIEESVWQAANAKDVRPPHNGRYASVGILAGGLARCATCGSRMGIVRSGNGAWSYKCRSAGDTPCTAPASLVVNYADAQVLPILQQRVDAGRDVRADAADEARVQKAYERAERALDQFLADMRDPDARAEMGDRYAGDLAARRQAIIDAQAEVEAFQTRQATSLYANVHGPVADSPIDVQRDLARALLDRVVIRPRRDDTGPRVEVITR